MQMDTEKLMDIQKYFETGEQKESKDFLYKWLYNKHETIT